MNNLEQKLQKLTETDVIHCKNELEYNRITEIFCSYLNNFYKFSYYNGICLNYKYNAHSDLLYYKSKNYNIINSEDFILEKVLPDNFVIARIEDSKLWDIYIKWLNELIATNYYSGSVYPYYGKINDNIYNSYSKPENVEILNLEDWYEIVYGTVYEEVLENVFNDESLDELTDFLICRPDEPCKKWDSYINWLKKKFDMQLSGTAFKYYGVVNNVIRYRHNLNNKFSEVKIISIDEWFIYNNEMNSSIIERQIKKLPDNFLIKKVDDDLWEKYIKWLNTGKKNDISGIYFNYYGINNESIISIDENYFNLPILTLNKWYALINEQELVEYIIKPEQAKSIIDIACSEWKNKLAKLWAIDIILGVDIVVSDDFYNEMLNFCTPAQIILFDQIFNNKKYTSSKDLKIGEYLLISSTCRYNNHIILKTFNKFVSITNPNDTWDSPEFSGVKVKIKNEIIYEKNGI